MCGLVRARRTADHSSRRQLAELVETGLRSLSVLEGEKPTLRTAAFDRVPAAFGNDSGCIELMRDDAT